MPKLKGSKLATTQSFKSHFNAADLPPIPAMKKLYRTNTRT